MTLKEYFHIIENLLEHHWAILENQIDYIRFSEWRGKIDGRIVLLGESYIDFYEKVQIVNKTVIIERYSYQYMRLIDGSQIFRYDNYPNHPGIFSPFHHKHTSKGVTRLEAAPKLIEIIQEAVLHMY